MCFRACGSGASVESLRYHYGEWRYLASYTEIE